MASLYCNSWANMFITILSFAWLLISLPSLTESKLDHGKVVVCYVGTWSVYRIGAGAFTIADINPKLCTHVIYSFVGLNPTDNTLRSLDPFNDLEENYGKGSYKKMTKLKEANPDLKVLLAVGGWNEGSKNYSDMALTSQGRSKFVLSALDFVTKYSFDGFDVDWEFPTQRGGRPEDKQNFVLLLKELKQALVKKNLLLTAAINAGPSTISLAYDVPEMSRHLDLIHVMTYDYHGQWDNKVGPNAPLNGTHDNNNLESTIRHLLKNGAPAHKIVIGIAAYGHTFLVEEGNGAYMHALSKPASFQGPYTRQDGFMGYNEICSELIRNSSWEVLWDMASSTPYAVNGNAVISYDNERSVALKVELAMQFNIGGIMVWSIDTDDFRGECYAGGEMDGAGEYTKAYPILRAIHRSIENFASGSYGPPVPPMDLPIDNNLSNSAVTIYATALLVFTSLLINNYANF